MVGVLADPNLYAFMGGEPPTLEALRVRYSRWVAGSPRPDENWHNWIIRQRPDGSAIGHVQASVVDGGRSADIAWIVGTAWQSRGYASEGARALVTWLESIGVAEVTAHIAAAHLASGRVAAAAGLEATNDIEDGEIVWRRPPADTGSQSRSESRSESRSTS
jgi:RimJ/RimL family protein N-acetyltransferase